MAEVVLFHHAQGLTPGVHSFADRLRAGGHVVHTPDLYEGRTFDDLEEGVGHAREVGFDTIDQRAREAAESLPDEIVYAGISLGAMSAMGLAQSTSGAKGAVLIHSAVLPSDLGGSWPDGLPLQVHTMEDDDWGDADVARELEKTVEGAEVFLYPGDKHLTTDDSLPVHDEESTGLIVQRVLGFLDRIQ